ncbi:translation initiation factor IF-2 N-terminal domain-containing protein [Kribbella sp.]|uniref:translation initiation factor IF-2 N-terminal domain-containing protein n=1 Tax=Kribbella sp. TaxID=1871183 RepID=UPI0039C9029D
MAKIRVYELAKELGVTSKVVLTRLNDLGEFVRSASSLVEATAVRRLAESIESNPPRRQRPAGRQRDTPFADNRRPRSAVAPLSDDERLRREAAAMFGVLPQDIKLPRPTAPRRSGPRPSPRGPQPDSWSRNFIDTDEKRTWIAAGLGPDDGDQARRCAEAGLSTEDLLLRVEGRRVIDRIRGGESIPSVAALVADERRRRGDTD